VNAKWDLQNARPMGALTIPGSHAVPLSVLSAAAALHPAHPPATFCLLVVGVAGLMPFISLSSSVTSSSLSWIFIAWFT